LIEEALVETKAGAATGTVAAPALLLLDTVVSGSEDRMSTGLAELDRVLGGGLVAGSLVLLGGEPGIGKSTLLLQMLLELDRGGVPVVLVSGEESPAQVKMRARRLAEGTGGLRLLPETQVEKVVASLERDSVSVCVVDSVQTLWTPEVGGAAGSVSQIREATGHLLRVAKEHNVAVVLVGHVTKDGFLAGPRVLEHMVDVVLAFEGDRAHSYRLLRSVKNRFGSTNEVGVFQMGTRGLEGVPDPTSLFLEDTEPSSGSAIVASVEGSRCLLAEIQALVVPSGLAVPRRVGRGVDRNRMAMVAAVLTRKVGLRLADQDVFVNVAGGLTLEDPASDLPLALAIASSLQEKQVPAEVAAFGEVSLTGHVRYAAQGGKRLQELVRRGFKKVWLPQRNLQEAREQGIVAPGVELLPVLELREAVKGVLV